MAIITTALTTLLAEQLDRHHVVVWFDPEHAYGAVARSLSLPQTTVAVYDPAQGFLALRRSLEEIWKASEPPRLLIYVPLASKETHNALAEYVVAGARLEPGEPGRYNTRLAIVARHALENILPATTLEKMIAEVEAGKLSLAEIESLAQSGQQSLLGTISLIFNSATNAEEIILQFLTDPKVDGDLAAKSAGAALTRLIHETLDMELGAGDDLPALRFALSRQLLTLELIHSLPEPLPAALKTIPLPHSAAARKTAVEIVHTWRKRRDLAEAYGTVAQKIEAELGLGSLAWEIASLQTSETFHRTEAALQTLIEEALIVKPAQELLDLAQKRLGGFWAIEKPEVKLRWQVIVDAARVLLHAQKTQQALKSDLTADVLFKRYTASDSPWCLLDTYQRHLERDSHNFDSDPNLGDSILKLVAAAQRTYAETTHLLSNRFVRAYEKAGFNLAGVVQQVEVYHDFVEPAAAEGAVAYFLVDAFRFEMARELLAQLPEEWMTELTPALATPPSITEVGMAALMPWAERGISILPAGASKLGVLVGDATLKSRPDRVKWAQDKAVKPLVFTELNKIAPLKDKHLTAEIKNANLVIVTASDEIDGMWENQPHMARQLHDHVFEQLRRGMRSLFGFGISKIIITADHGFLMGEHLMQGEPLDAPGGETTDLHRRMWVGKGGAAVGECLRKPLSSFGISGDLELVTPYGMNTFKVQGGSNEYFHGGLSLQEMVIPVLSVKFGRGTQPLGKTQFKWTIKPGSQKITTRFFTVTIEAKTTKPELFSAPPRVRTEIRAGTNVISAPVSASYGFNENTRDVFMQYDENDSSRLYPNSITLQIAEIPKVDSVTLYLLDEFGASLCPEIKLPLEIAY